ncbi:hypothetical protein Q4595_19915, partial [Wenyingzhuangia sp. 1_MG-2023]|nr:hypothetical protein [Wenyingzhuangia sp. 1_MG-2023]
DRQMMQAATSQILQNKKPEVAKEYLLKVFSRLHNALGHTPSGVVWQPAMAFSEWLIGQQHMPASAKQLLRELDQILKDLITQGEQVLNQAASDELVKNLLFYVARTTIKGEAIAAVRESFQLDSALPTEDEIQHERDVLSGP